VARFERNRAAYLSGAYNETQVRREFIDPLFCALGWDVENRAGYAEAYKDVIHEDAIKTSAGTKAPDYCFRVGGARKFFVEAKKPSVNVKDDVAPAYQLRRYAWSAKLPLSILTDFEEFAVYDCRLRPDKTDKASMGRTLYLPYTDYAARWEEIAGIFTKEAVLQGSFDKYAESTKSKKGTAEVDAAFLSEIEDWRDLLARHIALRNGALSQRELNYAVQATIDRLIFLRICEDRGTEAYGRLQGLLNGQNTYARLLSLYREADQRYNSGLFHFERERGRHEAPDELTPSLALDDKPLKEIIGRLYYPDSPYEFSVLPADILGQVYEQFLGKVIRLTAGHQAKVEDKPEVKKAGGVYYTPTYIVDYIVKNTVGKQLEGKTPKQAAGLRILDPACGSGSFLIGAYQRLLDWHRDWYVADGPAKHAKELFQGPGGEWRLTTGVKKQILLHSIYGVDIDAQAVETTKLSLLLKVLEGETSETINSQLSFLHERALPDLASNIKCGNSLIGPDFYDDQQLGLLLSEEERYRINVFDWEAEYPQILGAGVPEAKRGFDAIIGNPPYVDIKGMPETDASYVFSAYPCANNRINLFASFVEKSLMLVRPRFRFAMIVPSALLTQVSYRMLRESILDKYRVVSLMRPPNELFGASPGDVKVDTVVVTVADRDSGSDAVEVVAYAGYERISSVDPSQADFHGTVSQTQWRRSPECVWSLVSQDAEALLERCERGAVFLVDCAEFCLGLTPYDKYKGHTPEQIKNRVFHSSEPTDASFRKLLAGNDVRRYLVRWGGREWISYGPWLGAARDQRFFTEKRVLVKQIIDWTTKRIWAAMTEEELYNTQNAFILLPRRDWSCELLLGILNSRLMTFYHRKRFLEEYRMRFQKILIKDCKRFPMPRVESERQRQVAADIEGLVARMADVQGRIADARTNSDRTVLSRQREAVDRSIDDLVYELYGLTAEEIAVVERSVC
jgi:hypothetical protein